MKNNILFCFVLIGLLAVGLNTTNYASAATDADWDALAKYEYGQDVGPLKAIELQINTSMLPSEIRTKCAARLANLLTDEKTTYAAKQFICLSLRQIGTEAELPQLARLLDKEKTAQIARYAIAAIPGKKSTDLLRGELNKYEGTMLIGFIESVAQRGDTASVKKLIELTKSKDAQTAGAAVLALGQIESPESDLFIAAELQKTSVPTDPTLAKAALALASRAKPDMAGKLYGKLAQKGQSTPIRRSGLTGILNLAGPKGMATIKKWLNETDPDLWTVAAEAINGLSDEQVRTLAKSYENFSAQNRCTILRTLLERNDRLTVAPLLKKALADDNRLLQLIAIEGLAKLDTSVAIPILIESLTSDNNQRSLTALGVLRELPQEKVTIALLEVFASDNKNRLVILQLFRDRKNALAIDPLLNEAARHDAKSFDQVVFTLSNICQANEADLSRLIRFLMRTAPGKNRNAIASLIVQVCEKGDPKIDRGELIVRYAPNDADKTILLPLLGRIASPKAATAIKQASTDPDAKVQNAAVRALCNWPNADMADELWMIARATKSATYRRWALRGYIRVVSLKSDRPVASTLKMLQNAFEQATVDEDRALALRRSVNARSMETVRWVAPYLDTPALAQSAAAAIVDLAHHKFLRNPNKNEFTPILKKVIELSKDKKVTGRAKQYLLGM
jgi:HEAT repeat protein